jgi:hypothetical protein
VDGRKVLKLIFKELGYMIVCWIQLAKNSVQWWIVLNAFHTNLVSVDYTKDFAPWN